MRPHCRDYWDGDTVPLDRPIGWLWPARPHNPSMVRHVRRRRPVTRSRPASCITCDTFHLVTHVTIRELRNHGGAVVDRVARGEQITITRAGTPVAELRPTSPPALPAGLLLARWRRLPTVDPAALRADVDEVLDAGL